MYVIAKQAYGRERYYSIISQGVTARAVWVEDLKLAERFASFADAQDAIDMDRDGLAHVKAYIMPEMTARV